VPTISARLPLPEIYVTLETVWEQFCADISRQLDKGDNRHCINLHVPWIGLRILWYGLTSITTFDYLIIHRLRMKGMLKSTIETF
jgi:hypothetical protein